MHCCCCYCCYLLTFTAVPLVAPGTQALEASLVSNTLRAVLARVWHTVVQL